MTLPTTPSSTDSFDFPDNAEFYRLMGGDPKEDMREMRKEQKAQEKMLQEKREQERKDEAFARRLMDMEAQMAAPRPAPTWNDPSMLPKATAQTMIDAQGRLRRPEPSSWQASSPPAMGRNSLLAPGWPTPQANSERHTSTQPSARYDSSLFQPNQPSFNADDFIDLGSGDEVDSLAGDTSSDLIEIGPATRNVTKADEKPHRNLPWMNDPAQGRGLGTYTPTGISQRLSSGTSSTNNTMPYSYNNLYQAGGGYGGTNVYGASSNPASAGSSSWANMVGRVGENVANAAKGVYNAAYGLLDADIASVPSATLGYGSSAYGYGIAGSSSNPHLIPDVDSEPSLFSRVLDNHSINANDPKNRELVDRYMDRYNYLTNDPTKTSAEIKALLENIRPDEELPPENREGTPDAMTYPLLEHQKLGLAWMKTMEEGSAKGGILADDMGLH